MIKDDRSLNHLKIILCLVAVLQCFVSTHMCSSLEETRHQRRSRQLPPCHRQKFHNILKLAILVTIMSQKDLCMIFNLYVKYLCFFFFSFIIFMSILAEDGNRRGRVQENMFKSKLLYIYNIFSELGKHQVITGQHASLLCFGFEQVQFGLTLSWLFFVFCLHLFKYQISIRQLLPLAIKKKCQQINTESLSRQENFALTFTILVKGK